MTELDSVRYYLRLTSGVGVDAEISELIEASHRYIETSTGKSFDATDPLMAQLVKLLVAHWYTNRGLSNGNVTECPHSVTALLRHIEVSSAYPEVT